MRTVLLEGGPSDGRIVRCYEDAPIIMLEHPRYPKLDDDLDALPVAEWRPSARIYELKEPMRPANAVGSSA